VARIAAAKEARAPTPLMLILAGETDWTPSIWVGRQSGDMPRFARWLSFSRIRPEQASLTVF
jgi:hypothetical protein